MLHCKDGETPLQISIQIQACKVHQNKNWLSQREESERELITILSPLTGKVKAAGSMIVLVKHFKECQELIANFQKAWLPSWKNHILEKKKNS